MGYFDALSAVLENSRELAYSLQAFREVMVTPVDDQLTGPVMLDYLELIQDAVYQHLCHLWMIINKIEKGGVKRDEIARDYCGWIPINRVEIPPIVAPLPQDVTVVKVIR